MPSINWGITAGTPSNTPVDLSVVTLRATDTADAVLVEIFDPHDDPSRWPLIPEGQMRLVLVDVDQRLWWREAFSLLLRWMNFSSAGALTARRWIGSLGNGTSSTTGGTRLEALLRVELVDETGTTLRARSRYWQLWPPRVGNAWSPADCCFPLVILMRWRRW